VGSDVRRRGSQFSDVGLKIGMICARNAERSKDMVCGFPAVA